MSLSNQKSTEEIALGIRRRVFFHTMKHNGGYLSQACSAAESLALLYNELLKLGEPTLPKVPLPFRGVPSAHNPDAFTGAGYHGPVGPDYDRFFVSPAHYALVIYSALIETGRMDEHALDHFNCYGFGVIDVDLLGLETHVLIPWTSQNGCEGRLFVGQRQQIFLLPNTSDAQRLVMSSR